MANYFVGTQAECEALIAKLDVLMGYPNPKTKTTTYAKAREHHSKPGTWFVIIVDVWSPLLDRRFTLIDIDDNSNANEKTSRSTWETLNAEEAWPNDDLP